MYKAIFFDLNGTLINILTDEAQDSLYLTMSNLLASYGVKIEPEELRCKYFELIREQKSSKQDEYIEFDVIKIFDSLISAYSGEETKRLPKEKLQFLSEFLSMAFRSASMLKLGLYPNALDVLTFFKKSYRLAAVSDAQKLWAINELNRTGITDFFETIVISSDLGIKKPSPKMFNEALTAMNLLASEVIFVGNDMFHDIYGAKKLGMKTVFFQSNQGCSKYRDTEADYNIYSLSELPKAVLYIEKKAMTADKKLS